MRCAPRIRTAEMIFKLPRGKGADYIEQAALDAYTAMHDAAKPGEKVDPPMVWAKMIAAAIRASKER